MLRRGHKNRGLELDASHNFHYSLTVTKNFRHKNARNRLRSDEFGLTYYRACIPWNRYLILAKAGAFK